MSQILFNQSLFDKITYNLKSLINLLATQSYHPKIIFQCYVYINIWSKFKFSYIWNFTNLYLFPALDNDPQLITY